MLVSKQITLISLRMKQTKNVIIPGFVRIRPATGRSHFVSIYSQTSLIRMHWFPGKIVRMSERTDYRYIVGQISPLA